MARTLFAALIETKQGRRKYFNQRAEVTLRAIIGEKIYYETHCRSRVENART